MQPYAATDCAANNNTGKFITFEGIEGVGKTTNIGFFQQCISNAGKDVIVTREPGGTPLGETLRTLLLSKENNPITEEAELLLMFAARAQHLQHVIKPGIGQGKWVLCDRFTDATYAYQGGGRGLSMVRIRQLEDWVQGSLRPDLTILFDAPVAIGLTRVKQRGEADRFEQQQVTFFEKVRNVYLQRAQNEPQRFRVIDASQTIAQVQHQVAAVVEDFINA